MCAFVTIIKQLVYIILMHNFVGLYSPKGSDYVGIITGSQL